MIGKESMGKNVGDDANSVGGAQEAASNIKKIAEAVSAIGDAVSFISNIIQSFTIGGPIGVAAFIAIQIFTKKLTLETIKEKVNAIKDGFEAIRNLLSGGWREFLPPTLVEIVDFVIQAKEDGLLQKVLDVIESKINGMASPMREILQPLINFAKDRLDALGKIAELFTGEISPTSIIKSVAGILGFAFSSIEAFISMCKDMWSTFQSIFQACVKSGDIFVKYESRVLLDNYIWQVKIPGLCEFKGEGQYGARVASEFLVGFAKVPRQKIK